MDSSSTEKQLTLVSTHNDNFELIPIPPPQEKPEYGASEHSKTEEISIDMSESIKNTNENNQGRVILICAKILSFNFN